jgi:superfamily II RNA helicase
MQFRNLELDRFQVEAIEHINNGASVVVSAATGTGKTVIADYIIDKSFKEGKKVFYTAPIKALSNQKFAEFKENYGVENVGILTGDVVHNPTAPLLIMTTEIYRNMLLAGDPIIADLAAVVFDEIHYLGDVERGTVWEECIIFSPSHTRFVCLSATIPNARQFAQWIQSIKHHPVEVVTERKRAVPLEHLFFDVYFGVSTLAEMKERKRRQQYPRYEESFSRGQGGGRRGFHGMHRYGGRGGHGGDRHGRERNAYANPAAQMHKGKEKLTHVDLIRELQRTNRLSCIYFCFSRANTEKKAGELAIAHNFLSNEQRRKVEDLIDEKLALTDPSVARLETTRLLINCLEHGVAFHHAGLLPILKELVEQAFAKGLLYVLYATETFAVGINLPARTVCFDSLEKYDGIHFRYLNGKEYFQLAGRAGRRGLDPVGFAISVVDPEFADMNRIEQLISGDKDPLRSQYQLSYNTILNLISNHNPSEREVILQSSFYTYQVGSKHKERIIQSFRNKVKKLQELGYLEEDALTEKGSFARLVYNHELTLTELFTSSLAMEFDEFEIILIAASLEYEEKRNVTFKKLPAPRARELLAKFKPYKSIYKFFQESEMEKLEPMLWAWYNGEGFARLTEITTLPEGDIVRFMRRIIDVLSQVMHATVHTMPEETAVRDKITAAIAAIDRGIVQVKI